MKKIFLSILFCFLPSLAQSAFFSLHQLPAQFTKAFDPITNIYPIYTSGRGFKNQYNPNDAYTGCQIGSINNNLCAFPTPNILSSPSTEPIYSFRETEFRIYVPKGTTYFSMLGDYAQSVEGVYAIRFNKEPESRIIPNGKTYQSIIENPEWGKVNELFQSGLELFSVHPGGGTIIFLRGPLSSPLQTGGWLYFRLLYGSPAARFGSSTTVNMDMYKTAYANMQWDAYGDPVEAGAAPAFAITAPTSLTNGARLEVTAQNGTLKSCTVTVSGHQLTPLPSFVIEADKLSASAAAITVPGLSANVAGTVNCTSEADGRATATFTLVPADATFAITSAKNSGKSGGPLVLTVTGGDAASCTGSLNDGPAQDMLFNATTRTLTLPTTAEDARLKIECQTAQGQKASHTLTLLAQAPQNHPLTLTGTPTLANNQLTFPFTFTPPASDIGQVDVYLVTALTDPAKPADPHYFIQDSAGLWQTLNAATLDTSPPMPSRQEPLSTSGTTTVSLDEAADARTQFMLRLFNAKTLLAYRLKDDDRTPFSATLRVSPLVDLLPALPATRAHFALPQLDYPPVDSVTLGRAVFGERFIGR